MRHLQDHSPDNGKPFGSVMVIGGGISGIQASLDLADSGYQVYLVEKRQAIGGQMAALDKTFPTNDCATCIIAPKLVEVGRHPNIELITLAEVEEVTGEAGHFHVRLRQQPRYVDEDLCTACGTCWDKCPVKDIPSEFNLGLGTRKAIYVDTPQAVPPAPVIDSAHCRYLIYRELARNLPPGEKPRSVDGRRLPECRICEKLCPQSAIAFDQRQRIVEKEVGAIILATGFQTFDAQALPEYGYGRFANVITSLELERMLSASGPFQGHLRRPSDGKTPQRIAFIQCIGSRNPAKGYDFCSSVCCMYATKEAIVASEHYPGLEITIFYLDLRTFGKGFYRYYLRAKNECGIRYIRTMISAVIEKKPTKQLELRFVNKDGEIQQEMFDLVVLSVGMRPSPELRKLCQRLGVEVNQHGFCTVDPFAPAATSRPGIYICGTISGPKDIPQTVMEASAAAAQAGQLLSTARGEQITETSLPVERETTKEEPRIGAFICHCGTNIGSVVDVPSVVDFAKAQPGVVVAEEHLNACSPDVQERIKELVAKHNLNRVFVAACSPRTHEPLFQATIQQAGLNKYLFEMANIRDQCSWVHSNHPERATEKARTLVGMGLHRARLLAPLQSTQVEVNPRALIIGGGLAGMTAARALSGQGFEVFLVEKEDELGGNLRHLYYTLETENVQAFLQDVIHQVRNDPLIHVFTNARVEQVDGYIGNFSSTIRFGRSYSANGSSRTVTHGVIIVATGARESSPNKYFLPSDERVLTQRELEAKIVHNASSLRDAQQVVMIQCVGSRDEERPYCSRICCSQALKNALRLKEINPHMDVYVLYRDLMSYGLKEEYFTQARAKGVTFIRYSQDQPPEVRRVMSIKHHGESLEPPSKPSSLSITVFDTHIHRKLNLEPDLLVLSVPTEAPLENEELARLLKVPLDSDGFFLEAHLKLRPVDFATDGVYVCGLAHSPKFLEETIVQAQAVASRAATVLSKTYIASEAMVPVIDLQKCIGCGVCQTVCPFKAIRIMENEQGKEAVVTLAACKGCGLCSAACPYQANTPGHFTDRQLMAQINALAETPRFSKNGFEPKILGFLCNWCAYAGADLAGVSRIQYAPNLHVVRVMCTGRIDPALIVEALMKGIDGVLILGCHEGDCHYTTGNIYARSRMQYLQQVFESVGLDPRRFHLDWVSASEGARFAEIVNSFTEEIRSLGPIAESTIP